MAPRGHMQNDWQKKKLFILCGNNNEFHYWRNRIYRKTREYDVIYANDDQRIRGIREEYFIRLGNWFTLRDDKAQLMLEIMSHAEFTELHFSDIFEDFESEEAERDFYEGMSQIGKTEFLSEEEMWV